MPSYFVALLDDNDFIVLPDHAPIVLGSTVRRPCTAVKYQVYEVTYLPESPVPQSDWKNVTHRVSLRDVEILRRLGRPDLFEPSWGAAK